MIVEKGVEFLEFWSDDHRFGLRLSLSTIQRLVSLCNKSYPNETGGILVGSYNEKLDCATVTDVFGEIPDSKKGRTWFIRGVHGLQDKLNRLWTHPKAYYLGEWHFHPGGVPDPSQVDINQMLDIASNSKAHCPEPILLILSGANDSSSISLGLFVFSNKQIYVLRKQ